MAEWNELLRRARKARGMSRNELAERARVSPKTVANYETGAYRPARDTLLKLAGAMDSSLAETNALLEAAGFDLLPTGRLALFERRRMPFSALQQEIDRYDWPCLVMNDQMEILLWNEPAGRVAELDFARELPELPQRSLMRIAASPHFRERVLNWDEVATVMIAMLKADFEDPDRYAQAMPWFGKLLQELGTSPEFRDAFPRIMELWQRIPSQEDVARTSFTARWRLGDGTELTFNCLLSWWSDFDATGAFDWQPADARTANWLQQWRMAPAAGDPPGTSMPESARDQMKGHAREEPVLPPWHEVLRLARQKSGFSQEALGRAVGVSEETVYSYEAGRRRPSRAAVLRIARAVRLDGATTNLILTDLSLPTVPSELARSVAGLPSSDPRFRPGRWAAQAERTRELLPRQISAHAWPCWVLDGGCRIIARNAAAERVLGPALAPPGGDRRQNLVELLLGRRFREHVINYDEVASTLAPSGLKEALTGNRAGNRPQQFAGLLEALRELDPEALSELQRLWEAAPASPLSTRATSPVLWRHADGHLLTFNGVLGLWSDYLWYWALDWHPSDAATWDWLTGHSSAGLLEKR